MEIPLIGLGTYTLLGKECIRTIQNALEIGYRHFDTAFAYENHKAIAKALKGFNREELFLTTKLGIGFYQINDAHIEQTTEKAVDLALKELNTDYIDLMLIHWPERKRPLEAILAALQKMEEKGKLLCTGVSNYTEHHLQDAYDAKLKVPFNQVEMHPYLSQKHLMDFCEKHRTRLIAFRPFGKGKLVKVEPLFDQIGEKYGKKGTQVILRWIIQKDVPVIPKATSQEHLEENFNIFDFSLSSEEMEKLDQLNKNLRYCNSQWNEYDY